MASLSRLCQMYPALDPAIIQSVLLQQRDAHLAPEESHELHAMLSELLPEESRSAPAHPHPSALGNVQMATDGLHDLTASPARSADDNAQHTAQRSAHLLGHAALSSQGPHSVAARPANDDADRSKFSCGAQIAARGSIGETSRQLGPDPDAQQKQNLEFLLSAFDTLDAGMVQDVLAQCGGDAIAAMEQLGTIADVAQPSTSEARCRQLGMGAQQRPVHGRVC